jgi:HK97 family phage major capsid protein
VSRPRNPWIRPDGTYPPMARGALVGTNLAWGADDWAPVLIEALGLESAFALGGVRLIPTTGRNLYVPRLLADPDGAAWVAELEELPEDAGDGDTMVLTPRKIGIVTTISEEAIEDAPVDELTAVGQSLVRGVAKKVDARFFSNAAADAKTPAGILSGTLPGTTAASLTIEAITRGVGAVRTAGGVANVAWLHPDVLTDVQVEALNGGFAISDPTDPGINVVAGVRLEPTTALTAGTVVIADSRYIVGAVRRDAAVVFSDDAGFTRDGVMARVTMRVDWEVADPDAVYVLHP